MKQDVCPIPVPADDCLFSFKYRYFHIQKHILLIFIFWNSGEIKKETPTRVRSLLSTPPIRFADVIW